MDPRVKNTIRAMGIVAGLASLPMTWMTLHNAQLHGFGGAFGGMTLNVTAFNGSLTFPIKAPLWALVVAAVAANGLQFMANSRTFAIPKALEWAVAIFALAWLLIPMCVALSSGRITVGLGWILGVVCAFTPLVCLLLPTNASRPHNDP